MAEYKDLIYDEKTAPVKTDEAYNLQKALSSMCYYATKDDGTPLNFDGAFGKYTNEAVSKFAKDYGIDYNGTVSEDLYNAILSEADNRKNGKRSLTVGEQTVYQPLYANAEQYKNSAYSNAESLRGASYAQALKARQEAEALAEIQRKRSVVDASTMAEQQKATYGANAEQLDRMGLQVSGYSDYLNSQAYAAGMAGRQAANAQATETKRQATYQEALARLEADKVYSQDTAEADKTYYGMINEIEAQKISDAKEKEAQQQTNYGNLIDAIVKSNGAINGENVATYASALGVTDTKLLGDAKDFATTYWKNTPKTLTEAETIKLQQELANQEAVGDYLGAAYTTVEINNYTASDEQKQVARANYVAQSIEAIIASETQMKQLADDIDSYGAEGAKIIKEAFSNSIKAKISTLTDRNQIEKAINDAETTGLLTDTVKNQLHADFDKKYSPDVPKDYINIYASDFDMSDFGTFIGSGNDKSKQSEYTAELQKLITGGTLIDGDYILANYGFGNTSNAIYKYSKDGKFEKVDGAMYKNITIRVPDGYEVVKTQTTHRDDDNPIHYDYRIKKK